MIYELKRSLALLAVVGSTAVGLSMCGEPVYAESDPNDIPKKFSQEVKDMMVRDYTVCIENGSVIVYNADNGPMYMIKCTIEKLRAS